MVLAPVPIPRSCCRPGLLDYRQCQARAGGTAGGVDGDRTQIARLDEQLKRLPRRSPVCWHLMSVPAAGPSVALSSCRRPKT
jgi:hypothetical protein